MKISPLALLPSVMLTLSGCTVTDQGGGTRFIESLSPTQMGTAIIRKEVGMQDSAVIFEVRDPKKGAAPIDVGFVGDANWKGDLPRAAVWSKDGSVVAIQGADYQSWSHAYDFKTSQSVLDTGEPSQSNIDKLLESRGGGGPKLLDDWSQFDLIAKPVARNSRP